MYETHRYVSVKHPYSKKNTEYKYIARPNNPNSHVYPKELKTYVHTKLCRQMSITA